MSRTMKHASEEIEEVRSRLHGQKWDHLSYATCIRLNALRPLIDSAMGVELHRHVIVASVAALQTYHRSVIVSLVDSDPVYRERAAELITEKVPLKDALAWLGGERVTFGELIAHGAPCNNVADLLKWLGVILSCDIKQMLAQSISHWDIRKKVEDAKKLIPDINLLMAELSSAFKFRHIFAHEAAPNEIISAEKCLAMHSAISTWVTAVNEVIRAVVYKDEPLSTQDLNNQAGQKISEAVSILEKIMAKAMEYFSSEKEREWLINNHVEWLRNVNDWLDGAYWSQQGTMWCSVGGQHFAKAILERAERVRNSIYDFELLERSEGDVPFEKGEWWGL